jgi:hypothetical protein
MLLNTRSDGSFVRSIRGGELHTGREEKATRLFFPVSVCVVSPPGFRSKATELLVADGVVPRGYERLMRTACLCPSCKPPNARKSADDEWFRCSRSSTGKPRVQLFRDGLVLSAGALPLVDGTTEVTCVAAAATCNDGELRVLCGDSNDRVQIFALQR